MFENGGERVSKRRLVVGGHDWTRQRRRRRRRWSHVGVIGTFRLGHAGAFHSATHRLQSLTSGSALWPVKEAGFWTPHACLSSLLSVAYSISFGHICPVIWLQ